MLTVCNLEKLAIGRARLVLVGTSNLLLVRTGPAEVHAYLNRCPHLGVPLAWQDNQLTSSDGKYLQCSTHGAQFLMHSGECISGPCRGDQLWSISCIVDGEQVTIDEQELPSRIQPSTAN